MTIDQPGDDEAAVASSVPRAVEQHLAHALATAMLGGAWNAPEIAARCAHAVGLDAAPAWIEALTAQVVDYFRDPPQDAPRLLRDLLLLLPAWEAGRAARALARLPQRRKRGWLQPPVNRLRPLRWEPTPTAMAPGRWPVTPLPTAAALATLLDIDTAELAWFADVRSQERRTSPTLRHYTVVTRPKAVGVRVLEVPKPRLREIQRRILRRVLMPIPVHPASHGSVAGRSVATAVAPHAGHGIVVRADLESFFASVSAGRVYGVLRAAGYPEPVTHLLTGLTTTVVSLDQWRAVPGSGEQHRRLGCALGLPHLPQRAPTSAALANLVTFSLDRRLTGLAVSFGARYTRYVDDLVFSGPTLRAHRLLTAVSDLVADEGFRLADRKSVVLSRAGRQQVLGAVINAKVGVARPDVDRLRAILHNCAVTGWQQQARGRTAMQFRDQLAGQIAWLNSLDPARGARLREQFDRIDWPASDPETG